MSNFNFFLFFIYSTERKEDFFTSMRTLDIQRLDHYMTFLFWEIRICFKYFA